MIHSEWKMCFSRSNYELSLCFFSCISGLNKHQSFNGYQRWTVYLQCLLSLMNSFAAASIIVLTVIAPKPIRTFISNKRIDIAL